MSRDEVLRLSNGDPASLIDTRKPSFRKLGVDGSSLSSDQALDLIAKEPSILRRPIYDIDGEIVFGSDKDRLAELIGGFEGERPPLGRIDVTLHRDDLASRGLRSVPRSSELPDIEGRNVVLVDDVLFTGRTVRAALDALNDFGRPHRVSLAVLIDRGHRELPIRADVVGKNIPTAHGDQVQVLLDEVDGRDAVVVIPGRDRP